MLKIVLDSNILVSNFLTPKGEASKIVKHAKENDLFLSSFILSEVWCVLHYERVRKKYEYGVSLVESYLKDFAVTSTIVKPRTIMEVSPDSKDNIVLATAVEAGADYLITRNIKHFPKTYKDVRIVNPKEFLDIIQS